MKKQNLFLPLLLLLTSCFNDTTESDIIQKRWGFNISIMAKNVYHFYKSNTNKNEIIDFYAFSLAISEDGLSRYILNDKDAVFSDMVQSLVQDIPYDKTTILKKRFFDDPIFKFDITTKDYKYWFINKDCKDETKNNTGIRSFSLDDYDEYYDHLFIYIVHDIDMFYAIDINGGNLDD